MMAAMKLWRRKPSLMLVLVAALLALLALLATLQYRWLSQVSQGERERMQSLLRTGATRFRQDFDREITRAFLSFQVDGAPPQEEAWQDYAECYDSWMATAPYPHLVKAIFQVKTDEQGHFQLAYFNRAANQLEPREWPAEFATLREGLERSKREVRYEDGTFEKIALDQVAEEIPALIIPIAPGPPILTPERKEMMRSRFLSPLSYTIVTLDLDYLKREFIPALAKRHLSTGEKLDYNLVIVSRSNPQKVIYQSGTNSPGEALSSGDATADLLSAQPAEMSSFLILVAPPSGEAKHTLKLRKQRLLRTHDVTVPEESPDSVGFRSHTELQSGPFRRMKQIATDASTPERISGHWQLVIQHPAGSLEAAVARTRHRNLLISFGILLLLGLSVMMILIAAQRAQRLARQQMEFVAGVSHELRTPLAVICSAGENLADGVTDNRQQVRRYGTLIANEGRRLAGMVEQVLEFAGAGRGRKSYELNPVEVRDVIAEALAACEPLIQEGEFKLEKEIEPDLPLIVADAGALQRAIENLLNNAMKYHGANRWIKIKAQRGTSLRRRAGEVMITVEDRGLSISPGDLPHIFEPFYRGRAALDAQIHGSGLGLSLVKSILEAHGGWVSVESTPGQGSFFTLHLPAVAQVGEKSGSSIEQKYGSTDLAR